jgi:hypothetical protein
MKYTFINILTMNLNLGVVTNIQYNHTILNDRFIKSKVIINNNGKKKDFYRQKG